MTKKADEVTKAGAVELSEDALDQASGGAAYIKFDGVDGESYKISSTGLKAASPILNQHNEPGVIAIRTP